jgi:hypothetical protein
MSFIYRDFLVPARFQWTQNWRLFRRFDAVWGKEWDGDVQVYSPILYYWAGSLRSDTPFKKFINALGVEYAQLQNARYEGVDNVYFKLTPSKYSYTAPEKSAIVSDLSSVFTVGDEFELFVHYSGESRRVVETHWTYKGTGDTSKIGSYTIDTNAIRNTLHSDPIKYFANATLESAGTLVPSSNAALSDLIQTAARTSPRATPVTRVERDEDITHIYATLALLDNGTTFQQQGTVYNERTTVKKTTTSDVYFEYSYKIKYKVIAIPTVDSYVVNQIDIVSNAMETALRYKGGNIYAISNAASDTTLKEAVIAMNNVESVGLTHNGKLRVDAVAAMKKKDFVVMLGKIFGTGYTKKKTKWYAKAIALVMIVIAVVALATGLAAVAQGAYGVATAVLATTAAAMTVGSMIYASVFPNATDQTRMIGKVAQIVGVAAMITGVMAAIQSSWQKMMEREVASQMAQGATEQQATTFAAQLGVKDFARYLVDNMVNSIKSSFASAFSTTTTPSSWSLSGLSKITMADVSGWMRNLGDAVNMYSKFFGDSKQGSTVTEEDQATKEDGVESVYLAYEMIDNTDALYRLDNMVKNNLGGQKTENFLVQIA